MGGSRISCVKVRGEKKLLVGVSCAAGVPGVRCVLMPVWLEL